MPDLGNTSVFSQTDASNNSGTQPSWSGAAAPSTLDDAGRGLQGAVTREWNWRSYTLTAGGTADAKTLTYSVAPAAYYNGQRFAFIANTTNTTSATLNVNGLGAKTIKKVVAGVLTNLSSGDMVSGAFVEVAYNLANDCFVWSRDELPQALGTGDSPQFAGVNVGNASDTTITRSSAGVIAVEGVTVPLNSTTSTHTAQQIELGNASDTTITRSAAGVIAVEGGVVPKENRANTFSADQVFSANVGIGVTPVDKLSISGATSDTWSTGSAGLSINGSGSANSVSVISTFLDTTSIRIGAGVTQKTGLLITGQTSASGSTVQFSTGGSERLRITSAGGVSFGSSGTAYGTSGQVLVSQGNAPPIWGNAGAVLLGTLTTTSGTSQTLSSLVLTNYKFLRLVFNGVSGSTTGTFSFGSFQLNGTATAGDAWIGFVEVDLATGIGATNFAATAGSSVNRVGSTGYTTASTSVSLTISAGTFDAGSVAVYGVA